ncbi:52 kDa repressor of the inhibitor of the protein kinase-like [Mya arenaria]|uniref:52 kDa repressor of the inhibitor of the protein kinase-like n=1 Tax=Mya arenaria TaxID=6604 RepID=UPI0022E4BCA7|nr:52 kDa repressor of the inhibitor of the protein kinase-like [Mya arenaria]
MALTARTHRNHGCCVSVNSEVFVKTDADTEKLLEQVFECIAVPQWKRVEIEDRGRKRMIRAQCYDGATNMSGKFRGLQALVRERSPHANYVHCKSHCLNLALVHSSNIPCVRTMMGTVQDIGFLFDYSTKHLAAFQNELSRDALNFARETRWSSRADAFEIFQNAFSVVVNSLETLKKDGDEKAGQYLVAVLRFEFIISLVVAQHILSTTMKSTNLLQKEDNDQLHAVEETNVIVKLCNDWRADPDVLNGMYTKATIISSGFDIQPSRPRRVVQEIESRIRRNEDRYRADHLLPSKLDILLDDMLPPINAAYAPDLHETFDTFKTEIARWKVRCIAAASPSRLQEAIKDLYPCIFTIFEVLFFL